MRRWGKLIFAVALVATGLVAAVAPAALTKSELTVAVAPAKQSTKTPGGVSIAVNSETAYDAYMPAPANPSSHVTRTVLHFDNDFSFNTVGYPQCPLASIATASTESARATCPDSMIGTGTVNVDGIVGPASGIVTAFNGQPQGGLPTVLFHSRVGAPLNSTTVLTGVLKPSEIGGDFGKELDIEVAAVAGGYEVIKHFDVTVGKIVTKKANKKRHKPAKYYVAATCRDKDHTWNFLGDSTFANNGSPGTFKMPSPSTQTCKAKPAKKKKKK
jgi:hypothetical protein